MSPVIVMPSDFLKNSHRKFILKIKTSNLIFLVLWAEGPINGLVVLCMCCLPLDQKPLKINFFLNGKTFLRAPLNLNDSF